MHKLPYRCFTRQFKRIDLSVSLFFFYDSLQFFFCSSSLGLFMRKSLLAQCLNRSAKIRYSIGVNESSPGERISLHLLHSHEYICQYNDSRLNKRVQARSKRWLAEQFTQRPATYDACCCCKFYLALNNRAIIFTLWKSVSILHWCYCTHIGIEIKKNKHIHTKTWRKQIFYTGQKN